MSRTQRNSEPRKLWIEGPAGPLEAVLRASCPPRAGAVLAHPHPLHGGTLGNSVIFHADRELNRAGLTTLRFNFRGVGASAGAHDAGRGEVDDLAAAASWLAGLTPRQPLLVVGYSFGAWCAIRHAARSSSVAGVIAIGSAPALAGSPGNGVARVPAGRGAGRCRRAGLARRSARVVAQRKLAHSAVPGRWRRSPVRGPGARCGCSRRGGGRVDPGREAKLGLSPAAATRAGSGRRPRPGSAA